MGHKRFAAAVCSMLVFSYWTMAWASPVVIEDSGKTESIRPYTEALVQETMRKRMEQRTAASAAKLSPANAQEMQKKAHYPRVPIKTPEMSPGDVEKTKNVKLHDRYVGQPIFMVGADDRSLRWLDDNRERLIDMGAVGMLVQAESIQDVESVSAAAKGLPLVTVPGSSVAKQLSLTHYPVLITRDWIEQ